MLISMREFARRNGVSAVAISKAVKAGRLPAVDGKIDPQQAQPAWDQIHVARRADPGVNQPPQVYTAPVNQSLEVNTQTPVNRPVNHDREVYTGQRIPVTFAVNGAEELGLAKDASGLGVTIQSLVLSRCGVQTWRLAAPARASHRRPVRLALERRTITVYLSPDDHAALKDQSRQAGLVSPAVHQDAMRPPRALGVDARHRGPRPRGRTRPT
jgi:hypothetical protein